MKYLYLLISALAGPPGRRQRGLSQSTEMALLLGGAAVIAGVVVAAVTAYVNAKLPKP